MNASPETHSTGYSMLHVLWSRLVSLPRDGSFRFSLKFGVAGVLAFFVALLNKNHEPAWAIFTVFVLMVAQFIGAIEEKSFLRIVGTVIGGVLGYLITGAFQQDPLIFFALLGLLVAFTTAMFGQPRSPYAFLLCAMTAVVVCSNGLSDPQNSWHYMIWRIQEVVIGIVCVLVVQSMLWPRYAADEFRAGLRTTFLELREMLVAVRTGKPIDDTSYQNHTAQLQQLLRFGARESARFRASIPLYLDLITSVRRVHGAIRPLADIDWKKSASLDRVQSTMGEFHKTVAAQLSLLASLKPDRDSENIGLQALETANKNLKNAIIDLRNDPHSLQLEVEDILGISLEFLSLEEIHRELIHCHELLNQPPTKPTAKSHANLRRLVPGVPPSFWITNGIRAALSLITSLIIMNWAHPPGGTTMVLCSWLFCCLLPISPEGRGDKRAWHVVVVAVPCLLVLCLGLLASSPLLSSYAVMNIVIFAWLFLYGQVAYKTPGVTTAMNIAMMGLVGILGLNAQEPVHFQSIADIFFGVSTGTVIAALFQRTLWPLLPQREMRDRFIELTQLQRNALESGTPSPESLLRLGQLPVEILLRISNLSLAVHPPDEIKNLQNLLEHLDRFTANRIWESDPGVAGNGNEITKKIRNDLSKILSQIEASFSLGKPCRIDTSGLKSAITELDTWILAIRVKMMSEHADPSISTNLIGRAARYQNAATHLTAAAEIASQLNTSLYSKDNAL